MLDVWKGGKENAIEISDLFQDEGKINKIDLK